MDFLIDGQASAFCPDQPEAMLLTLIMLQKLTQSIELKIKFDPSLDRS